MKQMFLLFSHTLTPAQEADAKSTLGVESFVVLPKELQTLWSNIPPNLTELTEYLEPLKVYLHQKAKEGDVTLIQGDFGGCYAMVNFVKSLGLTAVHSTTTRNVKEKVVDGKVVKTSVFKHVLFREY